MLPLLRPKEKNSRWFAMIIHAKNGNESNLLATFDPTRQQSNCKTAKAQNVENGDDQSGLLASRYHPGTHNLVHSFPCLLAGIFRAPTTLPVLCTGCIEGTLRVQSSRLIIGRLSTTRIQLEAMAAYHQSEFLFLTRDVPCQKVSLNDLPFEAMHRWNLVA